MSKLEFDLDVSLVERLVAAQFPEWADLPVRPVESGGVDNRTFHLGRELSVRLPSAEHYALQVEKEQRWLPRLAPDLPLPIPAPLAQGVPGEGYPFPWSVYGWIEGETATIKRIRDLPRFAHDLADFLAALYRVDPRGGPPPGRQNFYRGGSLEVYDSQTRQALATLDSEVDVESAHEVWETALAAKPDDPPVWFHGDVAHGNLLVMEGRLSAVIDFGTSGVGDPACDLAIAWTLFFGEAREVFRRETGLDDATWARGRGWTLWKATLILAGLTNDPTPPSEALRVLNEVLEDHVQGV